MTTYVVLIRGINVGGKNKVSMASLRTGLEELGFKNVSTYVNSGNVILQSTKTAAQIETQIQKLLPTKFKLDDEIVRVLALTLKQFKGVVDKRPKGFGEDPDTYYSDAIFLMGITTKDAMPVFMPREGVDVVWPGKGVVYSQRLGKLRTKSRLSKIVGTVPYKSMTIRSWSTTMKLLELAQKAG
jgi:uncharacterized protein (DUF1697 family)